MKVSGAPSSGEGALGKKEYASSEPADTGKESAPKPLSRGQASAARRAIPRPSDGHNDRKMIAGYRPRYKDGFQR